MTPVSLTPQENNSSMPRPCSCGTTRPRNSPPGLLNLSLARMPFYWPPSALRTTARIPPSPRCPKPATTPTRPSPTGTSLPPELAAAILAHLPRRTLATLRLVSRKWKSLADRELAPHPTLGCHPLALPHGIEEFHPLSRAQLATLRAFAPLTTGLDVLPHAACRPLVLPNLQTLRIFPSSGLCTALGGCWALGDLQPHTLVVVADVRAGELLASIPRLVPAATLGSVTKLVLVVPSARGRTPHAPFHAPWAQDITLVLARPGLPLRRPTHGHSREPWMPPPRQFTVVGAPHSMRLGYQVFLRPAPIHWLGYAEYFASSGLFSDDETALLRRHSAPTPFCQ